MANPILKEINIVIGNNENMFFDTALDGWKKKGAGALFVYEKAVKLRYLSIDEMEPAEFKESFIHFLKNSKCDSDELDIDELEYFNKYEPQYFYYVVVTDLNYHIIKKPKPSQE